jgi:hypothetical protein
MAGFGAQRIPAGGASGIAGVRDRRGSGGAGRVCGAWSAAHKKPRPASRSLGFAEVGRGCAKNYREYNRALGFFVVAIEEFFSFRQDWHQDPRAQLLLQEYQLTLDSILESRPELQACAVHCRSCGIRFLTHPRNAGRVNLRCPFGCRQHHRREASRERSRAYYQTARGRRNKKRLNAARPHGGRSRERPEQPELASPAAACGAPAQEELPESLALREEGMVLAACRLETSRMLPYVRMVVRVIEGYRLPGQELARWLRETWRQHSIATDEGSVYVLRVQHPHPP